MKRKTVWLENLVLLNECVQKSGGIMYILASYTDDEGDVAVTVECSALNPEMETKYNQERKVKNENHRNQSI